MSKHPLYNNSGLQKNNKSHVLYALANKQMELKQLEDEYQTKLLKIKLIFQHLRQLSVFLMEIVVRPSRRLMKKSLKLIEEPISQDSLKMVS